MHVWRSEDWANCYGHGERTGCHRYAHRAAAGPSPSWGSGSPGDAAGSRSLVVAWSSLRPAVGTDGAFYARTIGGVKPHVETETRGRTRRIH